MFFSFTVAKLGNCGELKCRKLSGDKMAGTVQMKAVRFEKTGPSSVLSVVDLPVSKPNAEQVLVRVHAAGLNPVEAMIRDGSYPLNPTPSILGTDGAGVVEQVGANVKDFKAGDRVIIYTKTAEQSGTYAQYFLADPDMLFRLPEKYTFADGASLPIPFLTSYYNIVMLANAKAGEVVLVNGASGSTGLCAIEIARAMGCKVIGTAGNERGLALIAKKGATPISYKDPDFVKKVKEVAGSKGVDIVLETKSRNLPNDFEVLGHRGRICLINVETNKQELDMGPVLYKELNIMGSDLYFVTPAQYKRLREGLQSALDAGAIKPDIDRTYPLDQVQKAHDDIENTTRGVAGKLILDLA